MTETGATNAALKEWAIVCRALADGRQTILIRKGGIQEIKDGFEVMHRDFWLFPTYVHQKATDLVPTVREKFQSIQAEQSAPGTLSIHLYATVEDAIRVADLDRLRLLGQHHILSWDCVASRFHYRNKPGVHVLVLRVHRRPEPIVLPSRSWYDGCVSWVELDRPIGSDGCTPVLSDGDFAVRLADVRARMSGAGASA
ncbi:MAG: hypothetical protein A2Z31_06420 [candidate division NC10 bacterium RBG_16_65_8]|nr:MAG: hypothetical protein A2Z31_06420 [candidate division NC10 bacterium RBG_16_65_8]